MSRDRRAADFAEGARRFVLGLGKKVLIANTLGRVADPVFSLAPASSRTTLAWLGSSATRCRSISTSPATPTWRSGSCASSAFACSRTSTIPTSRVGTRVLAALAHLAVQFVPRLPVLPLGREPSAGRARLRQPRHRVPAVRAVARRELDVRGVGRVARRVPGRRAHGTRCRRGSGRRAASHAYALAAMRRMGTVPLRHARVTPAPILRRWPAWAAPDTTSRSGIRCACCWPRRCHAGAAASARCPWTLASTRSHAPGDRLRVAAAVVRRRMALAARWARRVVRLPCRGHLQSVHLLPLLGQCVTPSSLPARSIATPRGPAPRLSTLFVRVLWHRADRQLSRSARTSPRSKIGRRRSWPVDSARAGSLSGAFERFRRSLRSGATAARDRPLDQGRDLRRVPTSDGARRQAGLALSSWARTASLSRPLVPRDRRVHRRGHRRAARRTAAAPRLSRSLAASPTWSWSCRRNIPSTRNFCRHGYITSRHRRRSTALPRSCHGIRCCTSSIFAPRCVRRKRAIVSTTRPTRTGISLARWSATRPSCARSGTCRRIVRCAADAPAVQSGGRLLQRRSLGMLGLRRASARTTSRHSVRS